jgi:hypothetical protein
MKQVAAGLAMMAMGGISACSPYVFSPEISGFATGVTSLASSYQTGRQAVSSISEQERQAAYAAARKRLLLLAGCDQRDPSGTPPKFADCGIVSFGETGAPAPTAAEQALADAAPAFNALKAYADALEAVSKAADEKTLSTATQSLATAAGSLAGAVAKLDPAAKEAGAAIGPLTGVLGKGIAIYLDQRRYEALRATVPGVDPAVQILGRTVTAALLDIRAHQLGHLEQQMSAQAEPLEMASVAGLTARDYQEKLTALTATVAAFNLARAADPSQAAASMVAAHASLATALRDGTGEDAALLESIGGFVAAAEKVDTATHAAAGAPAEEPHAPQAGAS